MEFSMQIWKKIVAAYIAAAGTAGPFMIHSFYWCRSGRRQGARSRSNAKRAMSGSGIALFPLRILGLLPEDARRPGSRPFHPRLYPHSSTDLRTGAALQQRIPSWRDSPLMRAFLHRKPKSLEKSRVWLLSNGPEMSAATRPSMARPTAGCEHCIPRERMFPRRRNGDLNCLPGREKAPADRHSVFGRAQSGRSGQAFGRFGSGLSARRETDRSRRTAGSSGPARATPAAGYPHGDWKAMV